VGDSSILLPLNPKEIILAGNYVTHGHCVEPQGLVMATEYVSPEGLRLDGRRPHEMRHMHAVVGVVPSADGSALFHMGNTKVMAVVYGPHEVSNRTQQLHDRALVRCEYSMAAFSTGERRRRGKTDRYAFV
jgi:exosome complex component RRP41